MFLLDTNIISELMRSRGPDERVTAWMSQVDADTLYTTSINQAEIAFGISALPEGRRRDDLTTLASEIFGIDFLGRVLPFDSEAAVVYGQLLANRRGIGRPMSELDGQIASIAKLRGLAVVTRNIRDFDGCDLELVNPWTAHQH